jgi:hypothetical protein
VVASHVQMPPDSWSEVPGQSTWPTMTGRAFAYDARNRVFVMQTIEDYAVAWYLFRYNLP